VTKRLCHGEKDTQALLSQGVGTADFRIGANADKCKQNTTTEYEEMEERCEKCRSDDEELERLAGIYVKWGPGGMI
jgi:hypothetical protein